MIMTAWWLPMVDSRASVVRFWQTEPTGRCCDLDETLASFVQLADVLSPVRAAETETSWWGRRKWKEMTIMGPQHRGSSMPTERLGKTLDPGGERSRFSK